MTQFRTINGRSDIITIDGSNGEINIWAGKPLSDDPVVIPHDDVEKFITAIRMELRDNKVAAGQ